MKIVLAGATGVIGRRLLPHLVGAGHQVTALTRDRGRGDALLSPGAMPGVGDTGVGDTGVGDTGTCRVVACDVYDHELLGGVVADAAPDLVISQLTDLPDDPGQLPAFAAANSRMRRTGVTNLLAAARAAGCDRFLAQSVAWDLDGDGAAAAAEMERAVLEADGLVLRYGRLYGPGTYYEADLPPHPRVQVDLAAARTAELCDHGPGIVTIVGE